MIFVSRCSGSIARVRTNITISAAIWGVSNVTVGDPILVVPSGRSSRIRQILTLDGDLMRAAAPQSVTLLLEDDIDISRGDMIVKSGDNVSVAKQFDADICWLSEQPLDPRRKYALKHTTKSAKAFVSQIQYRVDVNTLERVDGISRLQMNDIARVGVKVQQSLVIDSYARNRATGSFIMIDDSTHNTVAAGMIV